MEVKVENCLPCFCSVVHDQTVPAQFLLCCNLRRGHQEKSQNLSMLVARLSELREPVPSLGDHEDVDRRLRGSISEGEAILILIHNVRRDLTRDNLVKDRPRGEILHISPPDGRPPPPLLPALDPSLDLMVDSFIGRFLA
jgi:hypothetical protein